MILFPAFACLWGGAGPEKKIKGIWKMNRKVLTTVFIALFVAIICIGGVFKIPLGPVPIVLQNSLCVLTGAILGGLLSFIPALVFIAAGAAGLPVFAGGSGGVAALLGPTGGFLIGYIVGAALAGAIAGKPSASEGKKGGVARVVRIVLAMLAGMSVLYVPGVLWFARWALSAGKVPADKGALAYTMGACVLPFIPGDLIKIAVCVPVALAVRPVLAQYLYSRGKKD